MHVFFRTLPRSLAHCFTPKHLLWQLSAALATALLVVTDLDWRYYELFRGTHVYTYFFSAAIVGFIVPVIWPLVLLASGTMRKKAKVVKVAWAIAQAELLALCITSSYKAFTGRAHPMLFAQTAGVDTSKLFHFGLMDGGVFWGWPSSHTAVAFAMAGVLLVLYPKNRAIILTALVYAFYIGIGVSMTIHWLSDFVAGAIIGTVVGVSVGKTFARVV